MSLVPARKCGGAERLANDGPLAGWRRNILEDETPPHAVTVYEVRDQYRIPISTQRQWRAEGRFVPFFRAGNRIAYHRERIERWIEEQEEKEQATRGDRHD